MKYAIVKTINGSYFVHAEGITDLNSAITQWHTLCATLWNAPDVEIACAMIVDTNLDVVQGKKEFISHVVEPEPVIGE